MRRFLVWIFKLLIIVAVGFAAALTSMRFAIHGREVAIPKFVGLAPAEAQQLAQSNGLLLMREERFYSPDIPEGRIMSQSPQPGTKVRRGWRVRVAESLGPQRVTIPNLVGQSERAANINVRRRGLELGSVAAVALTNVPPDTIVAQNPPPEAIGVSSPRIDVLVSAATPVEKSYVMPDLVGSQLNEAIASVIDAGLKVGKITTVPDPSAPATTNGAAAVKSVRKPATEAIVLRQHPEAGQKVNADATITFDVVRR